MDDTGTEWRDDDVVALARWGAVWRHAEAMKAPVSWSPEHRWPPDTKISEGNATVRAVAVTTGKRHFPRTPHGRRQSPVKEIIVAFAKDSQSAFDLFRTQGLRPAIDHERDGPKATPMAFGGHNKRRSVGLPNHGIAFGHANWNAVVQGNGVDYLEDAWFLDLVTDETEDDKKRIVNGLIYDASGGKLIAVRAPSSSSRRRGFDVVLPKTDTMRVTPVIATRSGSRRRGAGGYGQVHPAFLPRLAPFLRRTSRWRAGHGEFPWRAPRQERQGHSRQRLSAHTRRMLRCHHARRRQRPWQPERRRLSRYDRQQSFAPLRALFHALLADLPAGRIPQCGTSLQQVGLESDEPWEVRPSAHYHMGGLRADADGASVKGEGAGDRSLGIDGLFAAGQAMGGLGATACSTSSPKFCIRSARSRRDGDRPRL